MNIIESNHPLIKHKISQLRKDKISQKDFKSLLKELTVLISIPATTDLILQKKEIKTWSGVSVEEFLSADNHLSVIAILRAGLGMIEGFQELVPQIKVGLMGIKRNKETLEPICYFEQIHDQVQNDDVFILDPVIATGGSLIQAIHILKDRGCKNIKVITIIAAPEGLEAIEKNHPEVKIFVGVIDKRLNEFGYVLPGVGDVGDKIYGTNQDLITLKKI